MFFGFAAMSAYGVYVRRPSVVSYCTVAVAFTLSLLCKPMLVTLPFLLLVLDWWPLGRALGCGLAPTCCGENTALCAWLSSRLASRTGRSWSRASGNTGTIPLDVAYRERGRQLRNLHRQDGVAGEFSGLLPASEI